EAQDQRRARQEASAAADALDDGGPRSRASGRRVLPRASVSTGTIVRKSDRCTEPPCDPNRRSFTKEPRQIPLSPTPAGQWRRDTQIPMLWRRALFVIVAVVVASTLGGCGKTTDPMERVLAAARTT